VPVTIKDKQEFSGLFYGVERQCNKSLEVNPPDMFLLLNLYGVNSNTGGGHCLGYKVTVLPSTIFLLLPNLDTQV
jgi:hypothetical protein